MLFELAVAVTEEFLGESEELNWDLCFERARSRQERYYDAKVPDRLEESDRRAALAVGRNLLVALQAIGDVQADSIVIEPRIPGYRWIASGVGDFATSRSIIEVKCSIKRFSTADYRQVLMYWLLAYIEALDRGTSSWDSGVLLNPRLGLAVEFSFSELIPLVAFRRSALSVVESFAAVIDEGPES